MGLLETTPAQPKFQDGRMKLRVHVVPKLVSENVSYGENKPVFMIRNDADPRNAIQCRSVRFTGEVRGVFDAKNRLRGSQTAAWMETDAPVYFVDQYGNELLLDSQEEWKYSRNFDYDTQLSYVCGNAPSDWETPKVEAPKVETPKHSPATLKAAEDGGYLVGKPVAPPAPVSAPYVPAPTKWGC